MFAFLNVAIVLASTPVPKNILWLPLGDSITFGCVGPTIQDCHSNGGGYRVPVAYALSQPPLGAPSGIGYNVSTMGTLETGPSYVPQQWLKHEGHPGWQINTVDGILNKSFATSPTLPDLITIHLGTNDCNANVSPQDMVTRMNSLLGHIFAKSPKSQVFLADVIATGNVWNSCIKAFNPLVPDIISSWVAKGMLLTHVPMDIGICGAAAPLTNLCGGHQIHPTSAGYPRMASAFILSILENFKM
eukprot:m.30595 g.30595  ORF g.30595 m.30595 type:complete len:245 (-) comp16314_c0_seq1:99-833(-)